MSILITQKLCYQYLYLLGCHIINSNGGTLQPDKEVATSVAYEYNNRITSHLPTTSPRVYTATLLMAFNENFNA
jgi:hypothetical protein